jgi:hypothetical protein
MFSRFGHSDRRLSFFTGIGSTSGSLMESRLNIGLASTRIRRSFSAHLRQQALSSFGCISRLGSLFHSNAMTVHGAASEQKAIEASADVLKRVCTWRRHFPTALAEGGSMISRTRSGWCGGSLLKNSS